MAETLKEIATAKSTEGAMECIGNYDSKLKECDQCWKSESCKKMSSERVVTEYHKVTEVVLQHTGADYQITCSDGKDYIVYGDEAFCGACGKPLDWTEILKKRA